MYHNKQGQLKVYILSPCIFSAARISPLCLLISSRRRISPLYKGKPICYMIIIFYSLTRRSDALLLLSSSRVLLLTRVLWLSSSRVCLFVVSSAARQLPCFHIYTYFCRCHDFDACSNIKMTLLSIPISSLSYHGSWGYYHTKPCWPPHKSVNRLLFISHMILAISTIFHQAQS
jgi:hypothetical protein